MLNDLIIGRAVFGNRQIDLQRHAEFTCGVNRFWRKLVSRFR